jgi:hypothetical protein
MPLCWLLLRDALRALAVHHVRRDPVGFSRSRPVRLYEHNLMKHPASIYIYIYIYIYDLQTGGGGGGEGPGVDLLYSLRQI